MKKLLITLMVLVFSVTYTAAQKKGYHQDPAKMTQEQRMVQGNANHKNANKADIAKKVRQAKKEDRKARKIRSNQPKSPKRK